MAPPFGGWLSEANVSINDPVRVHHDLRGPLDDDPLWYKDAIIYELHVRAFYDSNGDGIGDFRGLIEKLDYLRDLGVTCIWLLPFFPSPLRDDGYDIADYHDVHQIWGHWSTSRRSSSRRTAGGCGS